MTDFIDFQDIQLFQFRLIFILILMLWFEEVVEGLRLVWVLMILIIRAAN